MRTLAAIARAFQVAMLETPPRPLNGEDVVRCPGCSRAKAARATSQRAMRPSAAMTDAADTATPIAFVSGPFLK